MPLDQAAIVELGRRRPDPADKSDMHRDRVPRARFPNSPEPRRRSNRPSEPFDISSLLGELSRVSLSQSRGALHHSDPNFTLDWMSIEVARFTIARSIRWRTVSSTFDIEIVAWKFEDPNSAYSFPNTSSEKLLDNT
jgi:hypothetical protein